jgi:hypothetical protein
MGYGMQIPAHRVGGPKKLWDFRVYGLSESWVTSAFGSLSFLRFYNPIKLEKTRKNPENPLAGNSSPFSRKPHSKKINGNLKNIEKHRKARNMLLKAMYNYLYNIYDQ